MGFKAEIRVINDDQWYTNSLCFETRREAEAYALELYVRWSSCVSWRVAESTDPVNCKIVDGKTVRR